MEKHLKKERNKLYLRITLIMLAVWIAVSSVFCVVYLNVQKDKIQSDEMLNLSVFSQFVSIGLSDNANIDINKLFLEQFDLLYDEEKKENNFNSQIIVTYRNPSQVVFNTAKTVGVRFHIKGTEETNPEEFGLIDYESIRGALSAEQFKNIKKMLETTREDGNYYELVCTKFQFKGIYIVPIKLKMVLVDGSDKRFLIDDNVETYDLGANRIKKAPLFSNSSILRNVIPKEFLLNKAYNNDFITSLTDEQKKQSALTIPTGFYENIVYVSNYQNIKTSSKYDTEESAWMFQYAKKYNLLDYCKKELVLDVSLIFGFFLTISVILCVMIWRTVKTQIVEENKRLNFTNALAHDIKTPLFVISGYAYSLQENIDEDEKESYLNKILEQTDSINSLVHKMLDLSKLDSFNIKLNRSEFDLYELTKELAGNYVKLPDSRQIKVTQSGDNNITADRELVKQAVENLIDNAVKYSPEGSVIEISVEKKSFSISNPSGNLTKSDLKNIAEPYVRKDKSRHQNGNGLGLSIVKSIADLHKAKFRLNIKDNIFSVKIIFS